MNDTSLANQLEKDLLAQHGPMIHGDALRAALGYPSSEAFRQAVFRDTVPVPTFKLPNHRGRYALVKDVAAWLAQQRNQAMQDQDVPR